VPSAAATRAISPSAAFRSGKNMNPNEHVTASKDRTGKGSEPASPWRQSMSGRKRRATVSMDSLRSRPTTRPAAPTRSAAVRATMPVPQATSSTASPAPTSAMSTRWGAHSANSAGTKADS
jgi:hypothetical protein